MSEAGETVSGSHRWVQEVALRMCDPGAVVNELDRPWRVSPCVSCCLVDVWEVFGLLSSGGWAGSWSAADWS